MNTQEQAYLQGFLKRANDLGFNNEEATELLKASGWMDAAKEKWQTFSDNFNKTHPRVGSVAANQVFNKTLKQAPKPNPTGTN
jgi:hypothetical protein